MGSNDQEIPKLIKLMRKLSEDLISPEDAMKIAQGIIGNKMDYR